MNSTLCETSEKTSTVKFRQPEYTVHELKDAYEVKVYVPGCNKDGINIAHEKDTLVVTGIHSEAGKPEWKPLHQEIRRHDYKLQLMLHVNINVDKVSAKTENGVLVIHLPVAEEAKPKQISVE